MTIDTQKLRDGPYLRDGKETIRIMSEAADTIDAQTAEIARLRGLVAEMADNDTYETEYDGRMYSICHGCGAQDGEPHRDPNCLYVRARAALSGESHD